MSLTASKQASSFSHRHKKAATLREDEEMEELQFPFLSKNQMTVQAEVHHHHHHNQHLKKQQQPLLCETESSDEDYHTGQSDDIELVELKSNGGVPSVHSTNGHPTLESSLSSYSLSSYNYSDYEHVLEESKCEVVDFHVTPANPSIHVFAPTDTWSDSNSVNIHEALDTLDQALVDEDGESTFSESMSYMSDVSTSSQLSRSMISLSLSMESDWSSTTSGSVGSQFSEATYRLGGHASVRTADSSVSETRRHSTSLGVPERHTKSRREFLRRVERFGADLKDACLFPLALPMDGSDIYKGASTWESINLLADCVLSIWTDHSKGVSALEGDGQTVHHPSNRWYNPVLNSSVNYLILQPELSDRFLLHPDVRLPFRRCVSETDLSQLGIEELPDTKWRRHLAAQMSFGGESLLPSPTGASGFQNGTLDRVGSRDEPEEEDSSDRNRSRSTLTNYLAKRVGVSIKEAKQRKDRFNLNLTKNMKTEAKRLASKNELENPYKFARKISKLEKRYYRSVSSKEFMCLVFKKGSTELAELEDMLEFGQELSQLIADLVCTEFTVDDQGQLIANAIETAFNLHQKHNYQSFKSVMRGLQLPEVFRLRNAWKVVQQKYPLHLRVYLYLTFLKSQKIDQCSVVSSASPSLPTLSAFLDLLRIRCLSIWDQLEGTAHWRKGANLVSMLAQYSLDEAFIEKAVKAKLATDMEGKLKKYQQKARKQTTSSKFQLKRLINPESKTMANVLRKEAKHARIGRDTISRLKASSLGVETGNQTMPVTWSLRSLRHLPSQYQMPVIREFSSLFEQLIGNIEAYKF